MHEAEPGPPPDRPHPAVGGASIEAFPVAAHQDRTTDPFSDDEIDGARRAGHQRHHGGLVAFADHPQGAVPALDAEVIDVRRGRFADSQPVQPEQHAQRGVGSAGAFGGEQHRGKLGPVETATHA